MKLQQDLREFVALLNSHQVEYLIVGGHAVAYHGYPRYTGDIDFFVGASAENAARLVKALTEFGFAAITNAFESLCEPNRIIQLGRPPNRIDLLTSISGVGFDEAWAARVDAQLDGLPVHFLGRDCLLKNKRASGRSKDLADIDNLE